MKVLRGRINRVQIGTNPGIMVGGDASMPMQDSVFQAPRLALEISQQLPDWPQTLTKRLVVSDLFAWAEASRDAGAELLCLRLQTNPDPSVSRSSLASQCCEGIEKVLATGVPLLVMGSGDRDDDAEVLPAVAREFRGGRLGIGSATEDTYQPIAEACRDNGHVMIAESPIDINICKQLNILATDMGLPIDQILIDPTTGGLGYGIEYTYSIMEKARLAALQGDRMLACPQICFVGAETWKLKEAASPGSEDLWGSDDRRGTIWEAVAATALAMAGASIVVLRDPSALAMVRENLDNLATTTGNGGES